MSSPLNPYESPIAAEIVDAVAVDQSDGIWRQGKLLVMHKTAQLPDRCVKSNQPTDRRLKRKLQWHHPAISLTILVALLVYIILAIIFTKKATIYIGLSDQWFAKRRWIILTAWLIVFASIAMVVVGIAQFDQIPHAGWLILAGLLLFLAGIIYGNFRARMVTPTRIDDHYVWLKGVCRNYLDELPEWPYAA